MVVIGKIIHHNNKCLIILHIIINSLNKVNQSKRNKTLKNNSLKKQILWYKDKSQNNGAIG